MKRLLPLLLALGVAASAAAQSVVLRNPDGSQTGTSSSPVRTDPTGATTQPVSVASTVTVSPMAGANTATTLQSAVTANGNGTLMNVSGLGRVVLTVNCAACSGGTNVLFEGTEDGTNFSPVFAYKMGGANNTEFATNTSTSGVTMWSMPVAALVSLRARVNAYSAGTITVTGHATSANDVSPALIVNAPNGSTIATALNAVNGGTASAFNTGVVGAQTLRMTLATDVALPTGANTIGAVTQASGPWTGNTTQLAGTAIDVNSGTKSAGTQRIVIATDQPQLTNALKVDGSAVTQPVSGTVTATQSTGTNLHMVCDSGCSSSAGFADNSAFTFGTTAVNPIAGVLDDTSTNTATENSAAVARITAQKALHINLRNNAGTEIGTSSTPVQVSLANTAANATAVKVDGSAVTQPISGTVTANIGTSGSLALDATLANPQFTAGTTSAPSKVELIGGKTNDGTPQYQPIPLTVGGASVKVDGSAVTQPISASSLPLPTGAATSAKQPALGTAGSASADVLTVQGIASMTALKVDGSAVTQPVSGTVTSNQGGAPWSVTGTLTNNNAAPSTNNLGVLPARATAAAPSYTEGNQVALSTDLTGALRVSGSSGGGVAQTQVRNTDNSWTDVGYYTGNVQAPVQDRALIQLLQQLVLYTQANSGYIRGTFGRPVRTTGDALDVNIRNNLDPCQNAGKRNAAISQTATTRLVPGMAGARIYVCFINVTAATAEIVNFTEGTGTTCGTGETAVSGSTTAANGESYAANGGRNGGNGLGTVAVTSVVGDDLCLKQNTSNRVAGNITYVYAP